MTAIEKAAARVVAIAEAEVGYLEKATNARLNDKTANPGSGNWTKYGAYFDALRGEYEYYNGKKNGYDWCDIFADWCFAQAFGIEFGRKVLYQPMDSCGAGCKYSAQYFKSNNAWSSRNGSPKRGDQIFFGPVGDESHTGLVVDVTADKVWTVEGNATNKVMRRTYSRSDSYIAGYGRPNYALVADKFTDEPDADTPIADDADTDVCVIPLPWLREGSQGGYVKTLQRQLSAKQDSGIEIDGDFGPQTKRILTAFQTAHGLVADGVCGGQTWPEILK